MQVCVASHDLMPDWDIVFAYLLNEELIEFLLPVKFRKIMFQRRNRKCISQ